MTRRMMRRRIMMGGGVDYSKIPLTLTALEYNTVVGVSIIGSPTTTLEYSYDGETWILISASMDFGSLNTGEYVMLRGNQVSLSTDNYISIYCNKGHFMASGNINSLIDYTSMDNITSLENYAACFAYLFANNVNLLSVKNLTLPATTLGEKCYYQMFSGCGNLVDTPTLPATTLATSCYYRMFYACRSLTTAPALNATTLAYNCYDSMFYGCSSIVTPPELPATTLTYGCYAGMFYQCISLTTAPELPATVLADSCYNQMFVQCTSLTNAPDLPATNVVVSRCYYKMFYGCSSLSSIKISALNWNNGNTSTWVQGVASTGTFTKPSSTTIPSGVNGIPSGWTIINV